MTRWLPSLLALGAAGALWLSSSGWRGLDLPLYLVASSVVSLDLLDLLLRVWLRRVNTVPDRAGRVAPVSTPLRVGAWTPHQMRLHVRPWAILVSVHDLPQEELEAFLAGLGPFRDRLWAIDDASTDDTFARLERAGVRALRGRVNRKKPGAIRELLAALPADVRTVVVLDPDVRLLDRREGRLHDIERVLFEFQRSRAAALCPRLVVRRDGWLVTFQQLEYSLAFSLGRKSLADHCVTSGVAVYRRDALESALRGHTLSVYAEDLKNAFLLLARGERIYYDGRLVFQTEGKRAWREWFSQRVGWYYGLVKVYTEHLGDVVRVSGRRASYVYQFLVYIGVFTLLLHPLKLVALVLLAASLVNGVDNLLAAGLVPEHPLTNPAYFPLTYAKYLVVMLVALLVGVDRKDRAWLLPAVPLHFFYALAHLVPVTLGYANWLAVRAGFRRLYSDHYQEEAGVREEEAARRKAG